MDWYRLKNALNNRVKKAQDALAEQNDELAEQNDELSEQNDEDTTATDWLALVRQAAHNAAAAGLSADDILAAAAAGANV